MVQEVLLYLSIIISVSAILAILARVVKQPPIIAYLLAGIVVGPFFLNLIGPGNASAEVIQSFARIGVAFLLFIVGLSLDFRLLKEIGKVSTIAGFIEILFVGLVSFFFAGWMGFSSIASFYIGVAIAFSSTVVVVKILSDKKEMNSLHGRIALGILIVQDIIASICLMIIPLFNSGGNISALTQKFAMAAATIMLVFLISTFLFNKFLTYLAKSQEALFVFGIAWALVLATIFDKLGFSIEIGALIAGMSLASSKYALDIEGKIKPLRDFFVILFFVFFGSQLIGPLTKTLIVDATILTVIVMIIKPLIVMTTLKFFGYTKRTNFMTSASLAQVSEFSLILILLGFSLGHVNQEVMNLAILVTLVTIGLSAYTINFSSRLSLKLSRFLDLFEGKICEKQECKTKDYEIVMFGYHRVGYKLLESIKRMNQKFAVVDYNPKVIGALIDKNIDCIYGDAGNKDFLTELDLTKTKMIISTIPDENANLVLLETLREMHSDAVLIFTAEQPRAAIDLYHAGADYVIIPHHLGGDYAGQLIKSFGIDKKGYKSLGKKHKLSLQMSKNNSTFS